MFNILKKVCNAFLDYVSYIILGLFGLATFKFLVLISYTETGRAGLILVGSVFAIIWASYRAFRSKKE